MSTAAWMRRQRDRPIAEHERRTAMAAVVVILGAVTVLLALTQPASQARYPARSTPLPAAAENDMSVSEHEAKQTAERFLAGYLGYVYGHTPAGQIEDATPALIRSLQAHPPRVPPAAQARRPRVLSLHLAAAAAAGSAGEVTVSAVVNDGGLIDYSVGLVLASEGGRLLVTGLDGA
jgi:hypothetical protein